MSSSVKQKDLGNPPQNASENMVTNSKLEAKEKKLSMTNEPPPYAPNASEKYPDEKRAAQSSSNLKEVSTSRARNKRLLWVLMACMVGCIFVVFTRSSLNFKINPKETVESYASTCSGHGIELRDLSCVCDLGYTGTHCQENYPIEPAHRKGSTSGSKPSVLLVTDTIGPLNPYNELASAYENIALHLGSNSFQVTVLYVGEENGRFSEISGDYAAKSIKLVQLPSSGLNYGPSPSTAISVDVFRWMLAQHKYDVVHFQANSGAGYYTLLAQKQGLTSWSSKFVVGLDSTSIHSLMKINSGDDKFLSTDLENLKLEYMQEKSIEYADTILAPSRTILDDIRALEWSFKESSAVVLPHIPSKSPKRSSDAKKVVAKELVFVGSLNILNGLPVFCDAIDRLVENDAVPKDRPLRVTYLGAPGYIRELTSTEYIEARSTNWQNIEWDIISEPHTVQEIVTYMTRQGGGSIAVLPRIYEGSAFLFQELVGNNVPIIASRLAAMEEFVEASSSINSMFDVNDFNGLVDRLSNAISYGLMPLEPASQKQKSWSSVFQEIANAEIIQVKPSDESNPLVSVVVVHRNRPKFLKQAIESLYGQTYKNFEVIIIDDGSDDPDAIKFLQDLAWEWWENRGWKVIREPHRYLGAARNSGIKHAGGSYILFMDDDDYAKPHQIETLVRVAKRTNADVVTAGHDLFDGENRPPGQRGLIERRVPLGAAKYVGMLENCFGDSNMMVLRSFFVDFGGFSEDFGVGFEDYEFLAKVVLQGHHLEVIPESLHWYRRHRDAMSFNTDRKANQIRFLRAYMEEHESAPHRQQDLLEYTKKKFFARDTSSLDPYENEPSNTTMTDIGPKPTGHPCGPSLIIDDFAAKDLNGKKINRLGLETNWVSMKDGAVVDGKLLLTPNSFDESYYYSVLSDGCFDATMFNTLEIVVGAQTPVNSSFAVVLRSPKDCRNNTDVNLRSLRTTQYATFNGTRQVLRIQLSDFDLDICRLHGVVFEDFSPSDGNATYVIDSIRLYTECMPYPTEVYQIPPTATGSVPTETSAFKGVAITSMTPPAANISSHLTFTFDGQGFQNYGVNLYCVVDGQKTSQAAVILSEKAASCKVKDLDVLGGHSLTLNVNGTTLPYSKNFFLYPGDAHVTTCQAKGYVNETVYVRVDGHNLINTGFVVFVVEGPDFPQPKIIRAVPAWSPFDPYGPPPESNGKPSSHDNFPYDRDDMSQFFDKYFPKDGDFPKDLFPHGFNPGYLPPGADVSAFIDSKIRPTLPAVKSYLSHLAEQTGADYLSMIAEKTGKIVLPTNTDGLPIPTDLVQSLSSLLQTKISTADLPKITAPPKIDLSGIQTEPPKIDLSGIQIPKGYAKRGLDDPKTEIMKAHSWTCPMNITTGGLYTVRLSLDGGITTVPGRVNTWIYDSAPTIVKAGFDGSGATVIVSFDKQIRILGKDIYDYTGTVDCSTIFDAYNEGVMKLGSLNDTTCSINEDMLQIALSPESTLRPGDRLQFTERTIFSKFNPFVSEGWLVNGTFAVTKPSIVPTPFVVAVAPKIVGSCDVASISVEQSYNDGGRPLTFYWSTNSSSVNVTNALKSVNNSTKTVLQLDKGLAGNKTYSFTITAENYLGGKSEATTISLFKSENPVPQIQILGSAVQKILMTQDYFLNTETTKSMCSDEYDTKFIYKWSFEPGSPTFTIPSAKLNSSSLFIKAGSLANDVYKLRVEVSTASAPANKGYDTIEIRGQAPPPFFAIGNGDVTVGVASELLIYAYWYDPLSSGTAPSVAWTCHVMDGLTETPCTVAGNEVLNPTTFLNPKNLQFTIPANTLLPNKQYKFTAVLTPTFNRLAITDDILVTTVSAVVPVVAATIILPSYKARRMLTGDVLNVFADVQAGTYSSYKKLSFAWNSVSGTTQVADSPVTLSTIDMNTIHVTKNREQLIIREKTLLPGNTYRFQVVVTDTTSGASGSAIVDVSVAKAPTIGSVIPNMSVGSALSDIFEITASQWTVDPSSDMPLSYQFDVFTSPETNGLPAFTFPYQISPKISTFLPTPTTGDKIWIVVTAKSMAGATSKKAISIQVNKVVRNPAQMKTVFADTAKVALASGDTGTYLRIASGVVDDLLAVLASLSSKKFRARDDTSDSADTLNEILDSVVTDVITPSPVTASTLELHACTLQKLVSMPSVVNSANAAAVLAVVHERIETLQAAQDASPDFRLTGRTKECLANTIGSLSTIYAQSFPSSEETRQTLLEASMLTNALYMRDMACGAPAQTFTAASTTEYLAKADLSSFSLSAEDSSTLVTFPDSISATNAGSDVNCFCMQETIQDAGLYSFVSKNVTGLGTVQIASTASNLRLRDCSSVPRDVPKNDAAVLHIEDLTDSVQLNLKLTPTSQTLFDAGKHDVQCVFYDTSNSTPILSTDGVTTTAAGGGEYTCGTSHLSTFMLVLSPKVVNVETSPTTSVTSSATSTTTSTSTETDTSDSESSSGIGSGAIAGIVIGVCGGAALAGGAAYFIMKKN